MRLSRCGLGTAQFGSRREGPLWLGAQGRGDSVRTIRAALDAGVTWIDTAPFYGWGLAEEIVGEAIHGRREEVLLLTKCGTVRRPDGSWREDGSPAAVRADVEASLRRFGVERIDVVQVHDPDPAVLIEDTAGALAELVGEGCIGAAGLSNHPPALMERAATVTPVAVVQHQWSLLCHDGEAQAAATWAADHGVPFLAWSPLASGFLTDGFDPEVLDADDRRRRMPWAAGPEAARLARLRAVAAELGEPLHRLALRWAARTAHPIVGARTPGEVAGLTGFEPLDDHTAARLESL